MDPKSKDVNHQKGNTSSCNIKDSEYRSGIYDFIQFLVSATPKPDQHFEPVNRSSSNPVCRNQNVATVDVDQLAKKIVRQLQINQANAGETLNMKPAPKSNRALNEEAKRLKQTKLTVLSTTPDVDEFWSILHEREENAQNETKLARQLEKEDLGHMVGPQLESLKNHLKKVLLCCELAALQADVLVERNQMIDDAVGNVTQIIELENELSNLLKGVDRSINFNLTSKK